MTRPRALESGASSDTTAHTRLAVFRLVALVEGVTTLALFLVAMPLKYGFDNPVLVPPVGLVHGIAFLVYVGAMGVALPGRGFTSGEWARTVLAAFVPFGTFFNDPMLKRKQARAPARVRPAL